MPVVPPNRDDMIDFFAAHVAGWVANQASIGITIIQAADLTTFITDAQAAQLAADTARNAAQAATLDLQSKATALRDYGGDLVRLIKAHAESQADPAAVYITAEIPQPSAPTPLGPPATPTNLNGEVDNTGAVALTWDASLTGGTQFTVQRQLTPVAGVPGAWLTVGTASDQSFTDNSLPQGYAVAAYRVTATRSGGFSVPTEPTSIYFGVADSEAA